jgi:dihydrodipicolinate synthase/N-acetylneuraminate lyase
MPDDPLERSNSSAIASIEGGGWRREAGGRTSRCPAQALRVSPVLHGAIAAAVTPLREGKLDAGAVEPYVDFLAGRGLDGVLPLGTTGEGVLFSPAERREVAAAFVEAARGRLRVAVHCGAQTTADTVALAEHAAAVGADAVAVIAPPYFALDDEELLMHFEVAARACAPLPFYVYEFAARSGYAVPLPVLERLRERAPNLAGLKVSDSPWERFAPYLLDGLDVFVGPEALLAQGIAAGAAGAVSGLAASFPEVVAAVVREPTPERADRAAALRASLQRLPFHAASKAALGLRGVPVAAEVRAPLRGLTEAERAEVERIVAAYSG